MEGGAILIRRRSVHDAQRPGVVSGVLRRDAGGRGRLLSAASIQRGVAGNESCFDDRPRLSRRRLRLFAEAVWTRGSWISGDRVAPTTFGKDALSLTKASPRLSNRHRTG